MNLINEQFRLIQRGIDENQHSFEILIDAFVHAGQGTLQPQMIALEKIRQFLGTLPMPSGLDYPDFPFPELQKIITSNTYAYTQYLVYVLEIPLFSPIIYHLYKLLPFPVAVQKEESTYSYINFNKEFIISDSMRQHYGKMTTKDITGCYQPNEITYVCKEDIPIYAYIPELDCEATMLHPSTVRIPENCEHTFFKLSQTFWIPLHLSNQWLFVAPRPETFTILCQQKTITIKLQEEGRLTMKPGCKGYSSYVTLYAASTYTTNSTNDYIPSATIDFDCCFDIFKQVKSEKLLLHTPLVNIMSSIDDLRVSSLRIEDVQQLIKDQESKINQNMYTVATSWVSILGAICLFVICICCSFCCCKCCRNCFFWLWKKWTPTECWNQTKDKCCVSIYNYNGSKVEYSKGNVSPTTSVESLPELRETTHLPKIMKGDQSSVEKKLDTVSLRTRSISKAMFR
jgi:hypothetical protein